MIEVDKIYFRQRQRNRLHETVAVAIESVAEASGLRKRDIADKLEMHPSQISRWLSGPANWTIDTVSDLLYAVGAELEFKVVFFR